MLETAFELGINLIETFICIDFVTRYLGCKYKDKRGVFGFFAAWAVYFTELSTINYLMPFEGIASLIPIVILFVYSLIFLRGSILLKLWISALIHIIVMIIAIGTNLMVCQLIGYNPNDMINVFNSIRVISVIITKVLLFYISRIILRYKYKNKIDNQTWFLLILIPITSIISLSALMLAAMNHDEITGYILCGMSGILIANIITYYFFSVLNRDYENRLKIELLEQNNANSKKALEDADAFVRQMKEAKHDMKNQLVIIANYLDNGQIALAREHIEKLSGSVLPYIQDFINTDNDAFDAIVNAKIAVCNHKKIHIDIREMPNILACLDGTDIGILFGNLLDNAIEAADKTKERRITVDIRRNGAYMSIQTRNSIADSVLKGNGELETTKKDKSSHGIGVKSIKRVVKKYNGMIDFFEESGEFCCHILLNINNADYET
jgi:two-component system sensor histidine kinase AgrC